MLYWLKDADFGYIAWIFMIKTTLFKLYIIYTNSNIHSMPLEKTLPVFYRSFQIAGTFTKGIYKKLSFYKLWSKFKITTLANFPQSVLCDEKYHILPYM